ncbi:MAG: murein biosynthesis integral membrane protein MurJ [Anaerolineae bacterium]|nr:murein biosynthesis integral membrane protein MurJ [Anaerolineae bacterium]
METNNSNQANRQIARAAVVIMGGFVLSNLTSLVKTALIARAFGVDSPEIDVFNAASKLPDILFNLVAGGALASAFIPTFSEFLEREDRRGGWQLASAIANLVVLILTAVSLLAGVFAPQIVGVSEFSASQQVLMVALLRILLLSPIIFGLSGLLMGVLNTHQKFWLPALAPTMYWAGMIFGVLVLAPVLGIYGLAWGAVLGAGLHLGVQLPGLLKLPQRVYFPSLGWGIPAVRQVGRLMAPRLLGVAVVQLNFVVNILVASGLPVGSLSAITVAFQIMTMPQVVIAQAISIAALPTFSAQVARGALDEMRASLAATLRGIILLSLPATLGLILLRFPIVAMLFERGEFGGRDTELVAWGLLWYTVGLVGHSLVEILSRAFYALHDTKTPVFVGAAAMSLNVVFSLTFPAWFSRMGWMPLGGLALSNSLATSLEMVVLIVLMRRRLGGLQGRHVITGSVQAALASAAMAAVLVYWLGAYGSQAAWVVALGGIAGGGLVYGAVLFGLRVPEVRQLGELALAKVRGK